MSLLPSPSIHTQFNNLKKVKGSNASSQVFSKAALLSSLGFAAVILSISIWTIRPPCSDVAHNYASNTKLHAFSADTLLSHRLGARLAVVIPFTLQQYPSLLENLLRSRMDGPMPSCDPSKMYAVHRDLVLYYHRDVVNAPPEMIRDLREAAKAAGADGRCFRKLRFMMAGLNEEEDNYPRGASEMFFRFWKSGISHNLEYMFYMEPDCHPCRRYWVDKLYQVATVEDDGQSWMRGSIIRDGSPSAGDSPFAEHLNGNALYKLDDPEFRKYLELVEQTFRQDPASYVHSYDIAIHLVKKDRKLVGFGEYADTFHRFLAANWIQNWYRTPVNATELCEDDKAVYLVHGRGVFF